MPVGIAASDRKLLIITGTLLLVLLVASVLLSPPQETSGPPVPSTYSTRSEGAEAAYLLLSNLHYPVRRWEEPPGDLPDPDEDNTLLILAAPTQFPTKKEREALLDFIEQGGHVLFTGSAIRFFFSDAQLSSLPLDPDWKTFLPTIPNHLSNGVQHVVMRPQAYWGPLNNSQLALYGEAKETAVVSWRLGAGQILWWAGSTPLTNAGISRDDNLTFFLNSVANWSKDAPYQILWDEYFHGQRSSLWSYVQKTSLTWGLLQLAVLACAVVFTFSRRSGPIYVPAKVSRLSPLEFVDTLGGLYERAGAASSAVSVSYQRFRSLLTRQLALPATVSDGELAQAVEQRLGWKDSGLAELLRRAQSSSFLTKLRPSEALAIVQQLEKHAAKLQVRSQTKAQTRPEVRQEKT